MGEIGGANRFLWLGFPIKIWSRRVPNPGWVQKVEVRVGPILFTKFPALQEQHINEAIYTQGGQEHPCACETWAKAVNGPP